MTGVNCCYAVKSSTELTRKKILRDKNAKPREVPGTHVQQMYFSNLHQTLNFKHTKECFQAHIEESVIRPDIRC